MACHMRMASWLAEMTLILNDLIICSVGWLALQVVLHHHRTFHNRFSCEQSIRYLLERNVNFGIKTIRMELPLKVEFFTD